MVEVLELDADRPASEGELGRIVVTDLHNRALPLIRYDTGDVAAWEIRNGRRVLTKLSGRRMDVVYDVSGVPVVGNSLVNTIMACLPAVSQIQIQQVAPAAYRLLINGDSTAEEISGAIDAAHLLLGEGADIEVVRVDDVPTLASGKRSPVVNLMEHHSASPDALG